VGASRRCAKTRADCEPRSTPCPDTRKPPTSRASCPVRELRSAAVSGVEQRDEPNASLRVAAAGTHERDLPLRARRATARRCRRGRLHHSNGSRLRHSDRSIQDKTRSDDRGCRPSLRPAVVAQAPQPGRMPSGLAPVAAADLLRQLRTSAAWRNHVQLARWGGTDLHGARPALPDMERPPGRAPLRDDPRPPPLGGVPTRHLVAAKRPQPVRRRVRVPRCRCDRLRGTRSRLARMGRRGRRVIRPGGGP
jgi:hypothetical protein